MDTSEFPRPLYIEKEVILNHFPHIYKHCLEEGYDVTCECIPVVPAQHYFMGGIWVDSDSQTSMKQLFAVGETSCNGEQFSVRESCVCKTCGGKDKR